MPPSTHTYISEQTKKHSNGIKQSQPKDVRVGELVSLDLEKYERKMKSIKIRARSELDIFEWSKHNYAKNDYWIPLSVDKVPRIEESKISREEFIVKYEAPGLPVVITGCTNGWPAEVKWNREILLKKFAAYRFKVGEDDNGDPVRMPFKYYLHYLENEAIRDDSPLYIFDSSFGKLKTTTKSAAKTPKDESKVPLADHDHLKEPTDYQNKPRRPCLLRDYKPPKYFDDDLFRLTGKKRPPYRWFVLGSERSGTGMHFDPLGTSAWNTLLVGHKRWCLFPPSTPRKIIDPKMVGLDHEAVSWFTHVFPILVKDHKGQKKSYAEEFGMIQVLQKPGETMYVPGGWYHVVMNLDFTIAVTQNFCSATSIENVWLRTRNARPKLAQKLLNKLTNLSNTGGIRHEKEFYINLVNRIKVLDTVPALPESSTSSSSSSNSSSSNSSVVVEDELEVSETQSESEGSNGECRCYGCKMKRKRKIRKENLERLNKQEEELESQKKKEFERYKQERQNIGVTGRKEKRNDDDRKINEEVREKKRRK